MLSSSTGEGLCKLLSNVLWKGLALLESLFEGEFLCGTADTNLTSNHEVVGSIPGLTQWVRDLAFLWLWCRLAATAPIRSLACELPYAVGVALKSKDNNEFPSWHSGNQSN